MAVSVCMASYNGSRYLPAQLSSILAQLGPADELIVVDDASTDNSVAVVQGLADPRIRLLVNEQNGGHVASFARAINEANCPVIMLADQDDVWLEGRVAQMLQVFEQSPVCLVAGNFIAIDALGEPLPSPSRKLYSGDSHRRWANIVGIFCGKRPYYGCAMAFRSELRERLLPIPGTVESHDLYIALAANLADGVVHVDEPLLARRVHSHNVSAPVRRPWPALIKSRVGMLWALLVLWRRG